MRWGLRPHTPEEGAALPVEPKDILGASYPTLPLFA